MNFSKQLVVPFSLATTLFLVACNDEQQPKQAVLENDTATLQAEANDTDTTKEQAFEPTLLMPKDEMSNIQFPLDEETIADYLIKGHFVPNGYQLLTDGFDGEVYTYRIVEDLDTHIATWDVLHVNRETAIVTSDFVGFDHLTNEGSQIKPSSTVYDEMLARYTEVDEAAKTILATNTSGEQHEINALAEQAKDAWQQYYVELFETTVSNVDAQTKQQLDEKAQNFANAFHTYAAQREDQADGTYLYGAGPVFEFSMYQLEFIKQSCDELLATLKEQVS